MRQTYRPRATRNPWFRPGMPSFSSSRTTVASRYSRLTASALPSSDALSTTTTSHAYRGSRVFRSRIASVRIRLSWRFRVTTT